MLPMSAMITMNPTALTVSLWRFHQKSKADGRLELTKSCFMALTFAVVSCTIEYTLKSLKVNPILVQSLKNITEFSFHQTFSRYIFQLIEFNLILFEGFLTLFDTFSREPTDRHVHDLTQGD